MIIILNLQYSPFSSHFRTFHLPPFQPSFAMIFDGAFVQPNSTKRSTRNLPLNPWATGSAERPGGPHGPKLALLLMVQKSGEDHQLVGS